MYNTEWVANAAISIHPNEQLLKFATLEVSRAVTSRVTCKNNRKLFTAARSFEFISKLQGTTSDELQAQFVIQYRVALKSTKISEFFEAGDAQRNIFLFRFLFFFRVYKSGHIRKGERSETGVRFNV